MKTLLRTPLLLITAIALVSPIFAQEYRYDWFGGAPGYSGYIVLDSPSSNSGSASNIIYARIETPGGSVDFDPAKVYASKPTFTWNEAQITSMFFAWGFHYGAPSAAIGANYDYNFNGIPHTYLSHLPSNPTSYTDESGLWIATNAQIAPQFKNHPATRHVNSGEPVTFLARAIAKPEPAYQWRKDGVDIAGATASTYTLASVYLDDAGSYTIVATNSVGSTTSNPAALTVSIAAPVITSQPTHQAVVPGETATFTVSASGVATDGFQWQRLPAGGDTWSNLSNSGNYAGVTTNTLMVNVSTTAMNGDQFRAMATNQYGSAVSNEVGLSAAVNVSTVSAVSAGNNHTMFIKTNGSLWGTGGNYQGQLGDGSLTERHTPVIVAGGVTSVSAGYLYTLFIKADGTLWAMGSNENGKLGDGTTTQRQIPVQVAIGVASVSASNNHSMFVKTDGTLWAMGSNENGKLGDDTTAQRQIPVQVASGVASVSAGASHSMFVKTDGTLWGVGQNNGGQLGDGTTIERHTPVLVATGVSSVSCGSNHTMFVKSDGTLWGMGNNYLGKLGDGTSLSRHTPVQVATGVASVSAASEHTLFVKVDGSLWAMGINGYGQLGDGTTSARLSPVKVVDQATAASASQDYSMFLLHDKTLWTMGRNAGWRDDGIPILSYSPAQLTYVPIGIPLIVTQPWSQRVYLGRTVHLTVSAIGASSFQWRKNGLDIIGAITSTHTIKAASEDVAGDYTVVATNSAGSVISKVATLTVLLPSSDFNGDAKPDLIWSNSITGERALWLMDGTSFIAASTLGIFPLEWTMAATGDFNVDGKPDLVWSNSVTGERALWLMDGTSLLGVSTLGLFPLEWTVAATGDFNADGKPDLVWSNSVTGERALWLMDGTNLLEVSTLGMFPLEWTVAATGDFNQDGKPDLVWSNSITGERALWLMDGTMFLASSTLGIFPLEWTVEGVGDYNGDGLADLIWSNSITGERALWMMNGTQFLSSWSLGVFPLEWTVSN